MSTATSAIGTLLATVLLGCTDRAAGPTVLTHGPLVAEVTASSARLWLRTSAETAVHVSLEDGAGKQVLGTGRTEAAGDFTAVLALEGLAPATQYRYAVRLEGATDDAARGRFRTAPAPAQRTPLRLAFGGDLAGQDVCRDAGEGFPILAAIARYAPDVFVGLGDMIYADNTCESVGRYGNAQVPGRFDVSRDAEGFRAHWRYARQDAGLAELLRSTAYVAVWDDHEVSNDFGPEQPLLPLGLRVFLEYNPVASAERTAATAPRLYRRLREGAHLELFVLDTRSYRSPAKDADLPERPKTLLGAEQRVWLERALSASDATWKVIVSSVPLAIPTGRPGARDGWANFDGDTGYERELFDLLGGLRGAGVRGLVWITTDVHFAEVLRHRPFPDDPDFVMYEVVTGPLNAGLFPNRQLDDSLHPQVLFFHGPASSEAVKTWDEARRWFSFGTLEVDADGTLEMAVRDVDGRTLWSERRASPAAR